MIQPGFVVVSVNGADAERTNASGVAIYFSRAVEAALAARDGSLTLTFRDPFKFRKELENFPITDNGVVRESSIATVSTKVAPAGTLSSKPGFFDVESGAVFDGSAMKINGEAMPGRGNNISLYFVLGKQVGQVPLG